MSTVRNKCVTTVFVTTLSFCLMSLASPTTAAQAGTEASDELSENISTQPIADPQIQQRLRSIYNELDELSTIEVTVNAGVVSLTGDLANDSQAERALSIARRMDGVVTVNDNLTRTLDVQSNVQPIIDNLAATTQQWMRALPLLMASIVLFGLISYLSHRLARWQSLWQRISPNPFLAELMAQAVRIAGIAAGLVAALTLLGANALIGTVLGGAGVLGLAIGFAVRDTLENYISSIMLSLRQPFRAHDHVVIDDNEGIVVRLTSRATVLMTLDGNHVRIPNSDVYKAVILNYSTNQERRFKFELGVDAEDDPLEAMHHGVETLTGLAFALETPAPDAVIRYVGDSNIVLEFRAWVDQTNTDFSKARSMAIRAVKDTLETEGFTLPEPIYRLRIDAGGVPTSAAITALSRQPADDKRAQSSAQRSSQAVSSALDVRPDTDLSEKVALERSDRTNEDLLSNEAPEE